MGDPGKNQSNKTKILNQQRIMLEYQLSMINDKIRKQNYEESKINEES